MGAQGWVSVAGNLAPNLTKELYEKIQSKDFNSAHETYKNSYHYCNL